MNVYWTVFIAMIVGAFVTGETYALMNNKTTLSRYVWTVNKAWPPLGWAVGIATGFLACHFFWGGIVCFAPA